MSNKKVKKYEKDNEPQRVELTTEFCFQDVSPNKRVQKLESQQHGNSSLGTSSTKPFIFMTVNA